MGLAFKVVLTALILVLALLGLYLSVYAFGVAPELLRLGRVAVGLAAVGLLVALWAKPGPWLWAVLALAVVGTLALLWLGGAF